MAIKLNEVISREDVTKQLKESYNSFFVSAPEKQLGDSEAGLITSLLFNKISLLLPLDTYYETIEDGKAKIATYLESHILLLVQELRNQLKSFNNEVAMKHNTSNFNPIDNRNIDDMAFESDTKSFSYAELMLGHLDFLLNNTSALTAIYWLIRRDCITIY